MFPISTILKYIRNTTSFWSLVLILIILVAGQFIRLRSKPFFQEGNPNGFGFGGPGAVTEVIPAFLMGQAGIASDNSGSKDISLVFDNTLILGITPPLNNVIPTRNGLQTYKVQEGDTLSQIAARFGISLQTLRWANPGTRSLLRPGEELIILPVSGILYSIREGDSLESIAARYQIDPETIKTYNPDLQKLLDFPGETLILPYAKPLGSLTFSGSQNLPNLANYFVLPARGWNWGRLHDFNAVDIADQCGKPIYASADGLVIEESDEGYWNQGHGNYLILEHPNGTRTRYSHTAKNLVNVGDYVSQGDHIALIGSTGNTHGPTGCHLHFEVHGARNPFAIR